MLICRANVVIHGVQSKCHSIVKRGWEKQRGTLALTELKSMYRFGWTWVVYSFKSICRALKLFELGFLVTHVS